jgi:hypothetical protein
VAKPLPDVTVSVGESYTIQGPNKQRYCWKWTEITPTKKSTSLNLGGLNDPKQTADEGKNFELQ